MNTTKVNSLGGIGRHNSKENNDGKETLTGLLPSLFSKSINKVQNRRPI